MKISKSLFNKKQSSENRLTLGSKTLKSTANKATECNIKAGEFLQNDLFSKNVNGCSNITSSDC